MTEHAQYAAPRLAGMDAAQAYAACKRDGLDQLAGIRMLREVHGLSLEDAKKVSFEVDTGQPSEKSQPGLQKQLTDVLDELLGD